MSGLASSGQRGWRDALLAAYALELMALLTKLNSHKPSGNGMKEPHFRQSDAGFDGRVGRNRDYVSSSWNQYSIRDFCTCTGSELEAHMPCTPAQQALDQAQSIAFMRNFYASLGMRKLTLERAIQHVKRLPLAPSAPAARRRRGGSRQPDNPNISCCGEADAFEADMFEIDGDHYVAIITDGKGVLAPGTRIATNPARPARDRSAGR
jgi:hypothetical protein